MIRGLFEYLYRADGLTLVPHIPPAITRLEQKYPIRFGTKRLYLAVTGQGPITAVRVNGEEWRTFDASRFSCRIRAPLRRPQCRSFEVKRRRFHSRHPRPTTLCRRGQPCHPGLTPAGYGLRRTRARFHAAMVKAGMGATYEAAHARLVVRISSGARSCWRRDTRASGGSFSGGGGQALSRHHHPVV